MEGDRGAGDREKREWEVYGRREKRGREAGFPRWREAGEKGKNYATLCNISQSKKCKGAGAKKYRVGTGIKGYGKQEVYTPLSPPLLWTHLELRVCFTFCTPTLDALFTTSWKSSASFNLIRLLQVQSNPNINIDNNTKSLLSWTVFLVPVHIL